MRIDDCMIKRIVDIIISALLLIVLSPLILIITILIKIDSHGSVFFIQDRIGLDGKLFKIYKLRTMYTSVKKYEECPKDLKDIRITRIGVFLRRTSLDELPQLINVLKGDMSIVGPRPEMPFIVEKYNARHMERLKVKPGITGLWQINSKKGIPIHENMELDLAYIRNQSLKFDMMIILKTIIFVKKNI